MPILYQTKEVLYCDILRFFLCNIVTFKCVCTLIYDDEEHFTLCLEEELVFIGHSYSQLEWLENCCSVWLSQFLFLLVITLVCLLNLTSLENIKVFHPLSLSYMTNDFTKICEFKLQMDVLRNVIRYQKVLLRVKNSLLKLTGNLETLLTSLN